jgi:hypothetical protein
MIPEVYACKSAVRALVQDSHLAGEAYLHI